MTTIIIGSTAHLSIDPYATATRTVQDAKNNTVEMLVPNQWLYATSPIFIE